MPDCSLTVLGFDLGSHWIGVAVGQTTSATASPLPPIKVIKNKPDWHSIGALITEWQPNRLVIGLPLKMNDSTTDMTAPARRFCRQLEGRFHLPTELADERLTTREAWQLVEQQATRRISKPERDSIAAVLITETWLHQQH